MAASKKRKKRLTKKALKEMGVQGRAIDLIIGSAFSEICKFIQAVDTEPDSAMADMQLELAVLQGWSASVGEKKK